MAASRGKGVRVVGLEDQLVAAATRDLDSQLGDIVDAVRVRASAWRADPVLARRERRVLAARLRSLKPAVAESVWSLVYAGNHVTVDGKKVLVDTLGDVEVRRILRRVDVKVRKKARRAATALGNDRLNTDVQVRAMTARIMAVGSPADAAGAAVAVRVAYLAKKKDADGEPLVWVTRPNCCPHCASMAGSVSQDDGLFRPRINIVDHPLAWMVRGVDGPPLHDHCRCNVVKASRGLAESLARNTARDVAEGRLGHISHAAKARAARRILRSRAPLTAHARRRAAVLARSA